MLHVHLHNSNCCHSAVVFSMSTERKFIFLQNFIYVKYCWRTSTHLTADIWAFNSHLDYKSSHHDKLQYAHFYVIAPCSLSKWYLYYLYVRIASGLYMYFIHRVKTPRSVPLHFLLKLVDFFTGIYRARISFMPFLVWSNAFLKMGA